MIDGFLRWLDTPVSHQAHCFDPVEQVPRWQRIAYLVTCNGGSPVVRSWGITGYRGGPWKSGLSQEEALELIFISGVLEGLSVSGIDWHRELDRRISEWAHAQVTAYEATQPQ